MITFSDLLTLMLTFFVLLFSMSSLDAKSLKELTETEAMSGGDGVLEIGQPEKVQAVDAKDKPTVTPRKMPLSPRMWRNICGWWGVASPTSGDVSWSSGFVSAGSKRRLR